VIKIYKIPLAFILIYAILISSKFNLPKKEGTWQQQRKQNVQPKRAKGQSVRMLQAENRNSVHLTRKNNVGL
jgi:hypothetical protein